MFGITVFLEHMKLVKLWVLELIVVIDVLPNCDQFEEMGWKQKIFKWIYERIVNHFGLGF